MSDEINAGTGPNIVLRDHDDTPVEHEFPAKLQVDTADGGTTKYVHESLVAEPVEKTVELDFSGGDMVVVPEEGQTFSAVNIPIPDNLIPENIAEGVDIAGIVGTMAAGGGGLANICVGIFRAGYSYQGENKPVTLIEKSELDKIGFGSAAKRFALLVSVTGAAFGDYNKNVHGLLFQSSFEYARHGSSLNLYGVSTYSYRNSSSALDQTVSTSNISKDTLSTKTAGRMFYDSTNGLQYYGGSYYPLYWQDYLVIAGVVD